MFIEQLYTGCLSEAAYYIESEGEAAIIDPLRDIDEYLHLANERKTKIKYIFAPPGWSHDGSTLTSEQLRKQNNSNSFLDTSKKS